MESPNIMQTIELQNIVHAALERFSPLPQQIVDCLPAGVDAETREKIRARATEHLDGALRQFAESLGAQQ